MYCKFCDQQIESSSKFCSSCGKSQSSQSGNAERLSKANKIAIIMGIVFGIGGIFLGAKTIESIINKKVESSQQIKLEAVSSKNQKQALQELDLREYLPNTIGIIKENVSYMDYDQPWCLIRTVIENDAINTDYSSNMIQETFYTNVGDDLTDYIGSHTKVYEQDKDYIKVLYWTYGGNPYGDEDVELCKEEEWTYMGNSRRISGINKKVETTAGVFENCIQVIEKRTGSADARYSYAPKLGLIKVEELKDGENDILVLEDLVRYSLPNVQEEMDMLPDEYEEMNESIDEALQKVRNLNGEHLDYFFEKGFQTGYLLDGMPADEFFYIFAMDNDKTLDDKFYVHRLTGKVYIETSDGVVHNLETREIVDKKEVIYEPDEDMTLEYINSEYGFKIRIPQSWEGKYQVKENSWYTGADKTIDFNCVIDGVDYGNIFSLIVLDGGDGAVGQFLRFVGTIKNKDIAACFAGESSDLASKNEEVLDLLRVMVNEDVSRIIASFELE